ncbi:cAMP-responsive element-binding protein-like 2 isoform X1 [Acinonyx jubatus]|uniref:cAMP-responsive element-binding protein-like 2 n=1 Tax=Acinonyx jubatus TaxID=32536 RepID=A0ABM3QD22_ACIJB|nr:cAMP-responsive element-binding protein-like 2 isoform X1 [Acinonyx jubatus]
MNSAEPGGKEETGEGRAVGAGRGRAPARPSRGRPGPQRDSAPRFGRSGRGRVTFRSGVRRLTGRFRRRRWEEPGLPEEAAPAASSFRARAPASPDPGPGAAPQQVVGGKVKKPGKRGRKPAKIDLKAKLERSRQSARECRARKKLRYQYLEELVSSRERAICALREELEMYKQWCMAMDQGKIPSEIKALLTGEEQSKSQQNSSRHMKAGKTDANSNSW